MNQTKRRICLLISKVCLLLLALPVIARADGAIGFLNGSTSQISAGQPFSWMEPGRDWDGVNLACEGAGVPPACVGGVTHAAPSIIQNINIVTSRSGGNLVLVFTIDDSTRVKPDGTPLSIGDKIIIELDPNNSGHLAGSMQLNPGPINDITTDYRFEVVINSGALDASKTGYRLPVVIGGGQPNNWGARTNISLAALTLLSGPQRYQVTINIPLSLIGNPANDIGIAFAVLNDLGSTASDGSFDVTGSEFPLSMGLDTLVNDLGLVDSEQASGSWLNPARWGVGYFSFTSQEVHFINSPSYYWSNSIKLSKCDVADWADVPASGAGTNQLMLGANWYRYNPNGPCKMKIWFNTFKMAPGAVKRRFLIVWGRPGISPQDWIVVTLTDPVALTLTDTKSFFVWNNVPAINFSDHPCLRIYILPEVLDNAFGEAQINAITTQGQLSAMEGVYGIQPNVDAHSAQMNFTATQPGTSCPNGSPCACLEQNRKEIVGSAGPYVRLVPASFLADRREYLGIGGEPISQKQDDSQFIQVTAEAFGVPAKGLSKKPYNYLERLGGIGWSLDRRDLGDQRRVSLELDISNPLLLQRDFTGAKPVDIKSPRRDIFIVINVKAGQGAPVPTIVSRPPNPTLNPGETVKGVITIDPTGAKGPVSPPPSSFKRFGLSFHAGVSFPHGNFGQVFDPGLNLAGDLEFRITPDVSLEGIFGYHRFGIQIPGSHLNLFQLSANIKYYAPGTAVRPFFNFGGGVYNFDPGPADGGINLGGGLMFPVNSNVALEGAYNFHNVFTSGANTRFSTLQGGIRFRF